MHYKELFLTGSTRASISHFRQTLEFVGSGLVDLKSLITARFTMDEALTAFGCAGEGRGLKNVIVFQ